MMRSTAAPLPVSVSRERARSAEAPINVSFIPYYDDNPYQRELAKALWTQGVLVTPRNGHKWLGRLLLSRAQRPDIVHLHWLPQLRLTLVGSVRFMMFFLRALYLRALGGRIVWTVHNLHDHDARWPWIELRFARLVAALSSRVIVHSSTAREIVAAELGDWVRSRLTVVPHGNYTGVYPSQLSPAEARQRLGVGPRTTVFLFLGYLRPYKGLNDLIRAFRRLDNTDCMLVIAGSAFNAAAEDELCAEIKGDARIRLFCRYVPEDEIQVYMHAADAVVFPYQAVLTSGAVILAMSFGKACVAPCIGCIPDVLNEDGAILYDRSEQDGLHHALKRTLQQRERLPGMGSYNRVKSEEWSWSKIAEGTAEAYGEAIGRELPASRVTGMGAVGQPVGRG